MRVQDTRLFRLGLDGIKFSDERNKLMTLYSRKSPRTALLLCGLVLTAGLVTDRARADQWDKKTVLTVSDQPIQIRETVLEPGQYVLRLLDSSSDRHVVQIFNGDQTHIINTVLAIPAQRLNVAGDTRFTFWETPPGTVKAMRTWYYPGDSFGQEFPYPKHLQQIAMALTTPAPAPEPAPAAEAAPAPGPEPAPEAAPPPEPQPEPQAQAPAEQPPAPATPESKPAPEENKELPKTASPYPLIGLSGATLLALYLLLRVKRPV